VLDHADRRLVVGVDHGPDGADVLAFEGVGQECPHGLGGDPAPLMSRRDGEADLGPRGVGRVECQHAVADQQVVVEFGEPELEGHAGHARVLLRHLLDEPSCLLHGVVLPRLEKSYALVGSIGMERADVLRLEPAEAKAIRLDRRKGAVSHPPQGTLERSARPENMTDMTVPTPTARRELRAVDLAVVREQLGRDPTTPFTVVARCTGGHPLVIRNAPVDAAGDPFPTTYWLTCPDASRAVSRVEADGAIGRLNERMARDAGFRSAIEAAHEAYAADRGADLAAAREWGGVAGTRMGIKCLHAHYAHHLAGGEDPVGRWVAERVEPIHEEQPAGRVAAIDQGTNSIRLLVVEPSQSPGGGSTELARDMVITRLGQGVDRTGRFEPQALARTIEVLARFCRRAEALGAARIRVGATSAVRDAADGDRYATAVRGLAGSELEVISGEHEAALSFLGATTGIDPAWGPFAVQDIGGGSTEFVIGPTPGRAERAISTRMGSVRMTERHIEHDPPLPQELEALEAEVSGVLDEVARTVPVDEARTFVAVAGTATTTQALALALPRYDPDRIHRTWLTVRDAERVLSGLAGMTNAERAALPVMAPGRGDVIVAGATILVTTMRRFGLDRMLVSETDILDGLALEMLAARTS